MHWNELTTGQQYGILAAFVFVLVLVLIWFGRRMDKTKCPRCQNGVPALIDGKWRCGNCELLAEKFSTYTKVPGRNSLTDSD